jgi:hypothetical protein
MSSQKKARGLPGMKKGPLVQMLDRQRVQQAAADEAKKLVDAAAVAAQRLVNATKEAEEMNQSDMKEAVKTAILQHDHVLLNLTGIIIMAKNHDSLASFPALCLAAEMLSVEVKTKGGDENVTRDTHHVNLEQAYRTRTFAREILCSVSAFGSGECCIQ